MDVDLSYLEFADTVPQPVRRAIRGASILYEAGAIDRAVDQLAVKLTVEFQDADPVLVTLVPQGAVLSGMLMRRVVFPLQTGQLAAVNDEICYTGEEDALAGRAVLLVGAGYDARLRSKAADWLGSHGCARLVQVSLIAADGQAVEASGGAKESQWVALYDDAQPDMGSGFSYCGYGANLPGLYRVFG